MASAKTDLLSVPLALDAVGWGGVGDAFLTADIPQVYVQGHRTPNKSANFVLQRSFAEGPATSSARSNVLSHTCRTPLIRPQCGCLWISTATHRGRQPHLPDRIATVAGPQHHTWRTRLPQLPDRNFAKSLMQKRKSNCKVCKALKDSEDQDLTYPQNPETNRRPASVAITLVASSICRFVL